MDGGEDVENAEGVGGSCGVCVGDDNHGDEVGRCGGGSDSGSGGTNNGRGLHMGGDGGCCDGDKGVESGEDGEGGNGGRRTEVFR